jgi:hypothetical protein
VVRQAGIAQFVAMMALMSIRYAWHSALVVVVGWLIGYIAARHALGSYDESSWIIESSIGTLPELSW